MMSTIFYEVTVKSYKGSTKPTCFINNMSSLVLFVSPDPKRSMIEGFSVLIVSCKYM